MTISFGNTQQRELSQLLQCFLLILTQNMFLGNIKLIIRAIFCFREVVNIAWKNINAHQIPVTFNVLIISREVLFIINFESGSKIQDSIYSQQAGRRQRIQRSSSLIWKLRITTFFPIFFLEKFIANDQSKNVKIPYVLSQQSCILCIF